MEEKVNFRKVYLLTLCFLGILEKTSLFPYSKTFTEHP